MISIPSLWLPILVSAVLVFVMSAVLHMMLTYHNSDFSPVPDEDAFLDALRRLNVPPGEYVVPFAHSNKERNSEEFRAKVEKGPVGFFTVLEGGDWLNMGPQLIQWFLYCLVVGVVVAYIAGRTLLDPTVDYLGVFRLTGTVAFACYALGAPQRSIWFKQNWPATLKSMFDGLVYACLTAGAFGWLWPS